MFLTQLVRANPTFIENTLYLYRNGSIPPDSYVIDVDQVHYNTAQIVRTATNQGISLYFMTKQFGRNPVVCESIISAGISKAVAVSASEALTLARRGVKLGHVGHLVQIPRYYTREILAYHPEVVTVFSVDAARQISSVAQDIGVQQNLLLRVVREKDCLYDGQEGGVLLKNLEVVTREISTLPNVCIVGVTSFPCLIVQNGIVTETPNLTTLRLASEQLKELGQDVLQINAPSVTCTATLPMLKAAGVTHGEPGHALTGTTPLHVSEGQAEVPSYLYITEVSHQFGDYSYVFGGGYYPRGHMQNALVGASLASAEKVKVSPLSADSIDYYLKIEGKFPPGTPVVFAFRTQMFETRSNVVPLVGIHEGDTKVSGIYTVEGRQIG